LKCTNQISTREGWTGLKVDLKTFQIDLRRLMERDPVCSATIARNLAIPLINAIGCMVFHQISNSRIQEGQLP